MDRNCVCACEVYYNGSLHNEAGYELTGDSDDHYP